MRRSRIMQIKLALNDTSGNNLRDAMEYAYKNGANHSDQSYTAVEGFKKAYLKDWIKFSE